MILTSYRSLFLQNQTVADLGRGPFYVETRHKDAIV